MSKRGSYGPPQLHHSWLFGGIRSRLLGTSIRLGSLLPLKKYGAKISLPGTAIGVCFDGPQSAPLLFADPGPRRASLTDEAWQGRRAGLSAGTPPP